MKVQSITIAALIALALITQTQPLEARTWYILPDGSGDAPTIQAGIDSASNGDIVELADGIFLGEGNWMLDLIGKAITVRSQSSDPNSCIIDCGSGQFPCQGFFVRSGEGPSTVIEGITVRFANTWNGGGVSCTGSSPVINNCIFLNNHADNGGGICCEFDANPTITNSIFVCNVGRHHGGAITCNEASPIVVYCLFDGNWGNVGGTVYGDFSSNITLTNNTIVNSGSPDEGASVELRHLSHGTIENTIIAFGHQGSIKHNPQCSVDLTCCDLYGNVAYDWAPPFDNQFGINGNISEDPIFCNLITHDFNIRSDSPCAPNHNPECGLIGALPIGCAGPPFSDVAGASLHGAAGGIGVAWGDYDDDGDQDLYLAHHAQSNQLCRNNGDGTFTDVSGDPLDNAGNGTSAAWGDYDNDGNLDLYLANASGVNKLFHNLGSGVFEDATTGPLGDSGDCWGIAWVDYDNDGLLDLYISNDGQANYLLHNMNGTEFSDATPLLLGYPGGSQSAAWGDYDNDGDQDLYLVIGDWGSLLFRNDGEGEFTDVTNGPLNEGLGSQGAAWGDYDNDGDLDLYLSNWSAANKLLRNDGEDTFTDVTDELLGDTGWGQSAIWGDYDNDGDLDLYLANYGQANKLLRNEGDGVFVDDTNALLGDTGNSVGAAWGDYDTDGDIDLYVVNWDSDNRLFRNNLINGNHWLNVKLIGTLSNRSAIGARVKIVAQGRHQIREIASGSGYCSQNSLMAEFGLGDAAVVDTLQVIWPRLLSNGQYHTTLMTQVPADTVLTITEGDDTAVVAVDDSPDIPVVCGLYQSYPNPFNPSTTIRFTLPGTQHVRVNVYAVDGRHIANLIDEEMPPGPHSAIWNGTDDQGRLVASGTYIYRLEAGEYVESKRMLLVR